MKIIKRAKRITWHKQLKKQLGRGQISPSGVVLETIFPYGTVSKHFPTWGSFGRVLHARSTQTARTTGEFGVGEQIASVNGNTCMVHEGTANQTGEFQVAFLQACKLSKIHKKT